jgi:tetratricopeptide (TPR) repeat protein
MSNAYNNLGNAYDDVGDSDKAIEAYNKAIALNPDFKEAYYNRSIAYDRKGMHAKEKSDILKAEQLGARK